MTENATKYKRRRKGWSSIDRVTYPYIKEMATKHGAAVGMLTLDWLAVVGPFFARQCKPERLYFTKGQRGNGTLKLMVLSSFAHEFPFHEKALMEKINSYYGYKVIAKITLRQVFTLPAQPDSEMAEKSTILTPDVTQEPDFQEVYASLHEIKDEALRKSLAELGMHLKKAEV